MADGPKRVNSLRESSTVRVTGAGVAPEESQHLDALIRHGLRVVRRWHRLSIAVFLAFVVPAGLYVKAQPSRYRATARILVERSGEASSIANSAVSPDEAKNGFQTQMQMLQSRPVITAAIRRIRLWERPDYTLRQPLPANPTDEQLAASGLVDVFLDQLSAIPEPGTQLMDVAFVSTDREAAMLAVNAVVQEHIDQQVKSQFAASAEVVSWLNRRLDEQRNRLEGSERALQTYVEKQNALSLQDQQNIVVQKLADLNAAVTRAKTERMAKQTLFDQVESMQNGKISLDSLPVVLSNGVLQQARAHVAELKQKEQTMSQDLGDRHPDLIKLRAEIASSEERLRAELGKILESVKNDYIAAQALEQSLTGALEAQKAEVLDLNRKGLEYGALQRQAASDRQLYERLLTESQTRNVAGKTPAQKIRVVEAAELPRYAISPQRRQGYLLVVLGGFLLALAAPFVREALDHRVKTPADLEKRLGLRCLAMVPIVKSAEAVGPLFTNEANAFNEAFRRVRSTLSLTPGPATVRMLVTSAGPREGKSVTSVNLAVALAHINQRVLLIDGDMRRPKVHKMLGLKPFPGLADQLHTDDPIPDAIRSTDIPNLSVLPCGLKHMSASELLSSPRLETLLRRFDRSFDWIVFDTPPIGPVADAAIIGRCVHHALLVVSAMSTPVAAAQAAVEQLEAAGVSLTGAILNRVDLERSSYYYSPYYGGEYAAYYSAATIRKARSSKARESVGAAS
jgi:polysaccharide biosynthesis transport protein